MSLYGNVVGGKLKLKGKALNVKAGGVKKKKKHEHRHDDDSQIGKSELQEVNSEGSSAQSSDPTGKFIETDKVEDKESNQPLNDDSLTAAERRYIEQRDRIDEKRLAKTANKSHRDRIQDFNQYLANLSEHYDIPKVGPG